MSVDDLPLFAWHQDTAAVVPFPLHRRRSKVVDVARKLITKRTEAHVDQYTAQVTDALCRHLMKIGTDTSEQARQISEFWRAVDLEAARLTNRQTGNNPRGAA